MNLKPREKLQKYSTRLLSDHELLQVIIGSGFYYADVKVLARKVLKAFRQTPKPDISELTHIKGVGVAVAAKLLAAHELGVRLAQAAQESSMTTIIKQTRSLSTEEGIVIVYYSLDYRSIIVAKRQIFVSSDDPVFVGDIMRHLILDHAHSLLVATREKAYNYEPLLLTICRQIHDACRMFTIAFNGFVVVSQEGYRKLI